MLLHVGAHAVTSCCGLGARELWHEPTLQPGCPSPGPFLLLFAASCAALIASSPMRPPRHTSNSPAHVCAPGVTTGLQVMAVSVREPCSSPALSMDFSGSGRKVENSQKLRGATS